MIFNQNKAELSEYSYHFYDEYLHNLFMNKNNDIPERLQILSYCFLYKGISYKQLCLLYGTAALNNKSISMVVQRLKNKRYLSIINYGTSRDNVYIITSSGIKYISESLPELIKQCNQAGNIENEPYRFPLNEIIAFLATRCQNINPAYWNHYLATRDLNAFLLSYSFSSKNYTFETEVGLQENGCFVSLYTRSLMGMNKLSHPVRCDAVLRYQIDDSLSASFLTELDTGSQRSALLKSKLRNYLCYYMNTEYYSPDHSLLFCIDTTIEDKGEEDAKSLLITKGGFGTKEYYYILALECTFDLLNSCLPTNNQMVTLGSAVTYLDNLRQSGKLSPSLKQLLTYFSSKDKESMYNLPISSLKQQYHNKRNNVSELRESILKDLHYKKYFRRRNLLMTAALSIPELFPYFLHGFSLYTASTYNLVGTIPLLLPEMFQFKSKLKKILMGFKVISSEDDITYEMFYQIQHIIFRNHYKMSLSQLSFLVENISDDVGGGYRLHELLYLYQDTSLLPSNVKLLCLLDATSTDMIKEMYLGSPLGKYLSEQKEHLRKGEFDILFANYESICTTGSLFTFSPEGNILFV